MMLKNFIIEHAGLAPCLSRWREIKGGGFYHHKQCREIKRITERIFMKIKISEGENLKDKKGTK